MAAGQGFKTFTTGEVLTAGDVNGYLMQGVLVFASAAARNAAITSPQEGQFAYTKDTNGLWYYDGAAWVASGATGDIEGVTAGVGISGGGTSGTVTITNDMATTITASGDIVVGTGTGTYDNLPIGTTNQVLTADTTVSPYKVKWATPSAAASGLTFLSRTSFSAVASQTFDGVFSSTYESYLIVAENIFCSAGQNDIQFQWRYSGTTESTGYYGSTTAFLTTTTYNQSNNSAEFTLSSQVGTSSQPGAFSAWVTNAGQSGNPAIHGTGIEGQNPGAAFIFGCFQFTSRTYTGFLLKTPSGTMSGDVSIYGLAKS